MKKLIFVGLMLTSLVVTAQEEVIIPQGVVYKKKSTAVNNSAKTLLLQELNAATVTYTLFEGSVIMGPRLWKRYKKIEAIGKIKNGNVQFHVPGISSSTKKDTLEILDGKLIQEKADFKTVWQQVVTDATQQPLVIRKATAKELSYYWAIINFDIDEPLFVVEMSNFNLLTQFVDKKPVLFWLEEMPKE